MDHREVERRLAEGQVCMVGWLNDEPVYYHWGASGSLYLTYVGLRLVLQPGDVFGDDAFTHPAARGRGIDAAGQLAYFRLARDQGAQRYLGMVAVWNRSSLRVADKLGRRPIALVDCRGPRPWQRCRVRGAARIERGVLTILASPPWEDARAG
jgi:GNAT superfamily N-acetyltransferase